MHTVIEAGVVNRVRDIKKIKRLYIIPNAIREGKDLGNWLINSLGLFKAVMLYKKFRDVNPILKSSKEITL